MDSKIYWECGVISGLADQQQQFSIHECLVYVVYKATKLSTSLARVFQMLELLEIGFQLLEIRIEAQSTACLKTW
jgi:hypothetical protein